MGLPLTHLRGDFHFVGDGVVPIGPPSSSAAELDLNLRFPGVESPLVLTSPDFSTLTALARLSSSAAAANGGDPFPAMLGMIRLVGDRSDRKSARTVRDCVCNGIDYTEPVIDVIGLRYRLAAAGEREREFVLSGKDVTVSHGFPAMR